MRETDFGSTAGGTRARVSARTGHFGTDDPFLHEEAVRPIEVICTPLTRTYRFDMTYLATPAVMFYEARIGASVRGRGSLPPGMLTFCVPVRFLPETTFGKSPLRGPGMPCSIGGTQDVVFAGGQIHFIVMISLALLRRGLPDPYFEALERAAAKLLLPASVVSLEQFSRWLSRVLHEALTCPRMLQFPEAVQSFEEDLVRQLAEAIECRSPTPLVERPVNRSRGLDRALDYLHSRGLSGVTLPELCKAAAVTQRTLERAFYDNFEMSARDYLRLRRLHGVRRRLMAAQKGETTVADIAYKYGFYELGRFAAFYARTFGERPSETLGRTYPQPHPVLIQI